MSLDSEIASIKATLETLTGQVSATRESKAATDRHLLANMDELRKRFDHLNEEFRKAGDAEVLTKLQAVDGRLEEFDRLRAAVREIREEGKEIHKLVASMPQTREEAEGIHKLAASMPRDVAELTKAGEEVRRECARAMAAIRSEKKSFWDHFWNAMKVVSPVAALLLIYLLTRVSNVSEEVAGVKKDVAGVTKDVTNLANEVGGVTKDAVAVTERVAGLTREVAGATQDVASLTNEVSGVTKSVVAATERVAAVTERVAAVKMDLRVEEDGRNAALKEMRTSIEKALDRMEEDRKPARSRE